MFRHAAVITAIVFTAACSSDRLATDPGTAQQPAAAAQALDSLHGVIYVADSTAVELSDIILVTDDGNTVKLLGPMAVYAASAAGRQIWVFGELAGDEMIVETYDVRDPDALACFDPTHPESGAGLPLCDKHLQSREKATWKAAR